MNPLFKIGAIAVFSTMLSPATGAAQSSGDAQQHTTAPQQNSTQTQFGVPVDRSQNPSMQPASPSSGTDQSTGTPTDNSQNGTDSKDLASVLANSHDESKNFAQLGLQLTNRIPVGARPVFGGIDNNEATDFVGSVSLQRTAGGKDLAASYQGGDVQYWNVGQQAYHSLQIQQSFSNPSWQLHLKDQLQYTPDANFGLPEAITSVTQDASAAPLDVPTPQQSILASNVSRLLNGFAGDLAHPLSATTSVSVNGGYSLVHYHGTGFLDENDFNAGLSAQQAFGSRAHAQLSYSFVHDNVGTLATVQTHSMQVGWSQQFGSSLQLSFGAGPTVSTLQFAGSPSLHILTTGATAQALYQFRSTSFQAAYSRGVGGGSGFLTGAVQDEITGGAVHQFGKIFQIALRAGYARNVSLQNSATAIHTVYSSITFVRQIINHVNFTSSYYLQQQDAASVCASGICGLNGIRQGVAVGFAFVSSPQRLIF